MRTGERLAATTARTMARTAARSVTRTAGRLLAVPLAAIARRRNGKPMHARGAVFDAVLERHGSAVPWGVAWLDTSGTDRAVARLSRGAGLPAPLPDLLGLAVRVTGDGGPFDLLLSTSGEGPLTRLLPVPRRDAAAVHSSIMGYRSDAGTVRLAAFPALAHLPSSPGPLARAVTGQDAVFTLAAARGRGPWQPFARLTLTAPVPGLDPDVRFDAVQHLPPGLVPDGPMARLRAPAYARARAARVAAPER